MANVSVDRQGRLVLPMEVRRRLGLDGRSGQLRLVETPDGVLLEAPPAEVTVANEADGLPSITIKGATATIENEAVLQAIEAERSSR